MTNCEVRCASTSLAMPDHHAEVEEARNRADLLVARNERDLAVKSLRYAADELAFGRFPSLEKALEFVFDEIL